jgi:hypothetical protein
MTNQTSTNFGYNYAGDKLQMTQMVELKVLELLI